MDEDLETGGNISGGLTETTVSELSFLEVLFTIIIAWILVALWQRVVDNFAFKTLGLDRYSTYQTFIIAIFSTVVFVSLAFNLSGLINGVVIGGNSQSQNNEFFSTVEGPVKRTVQEIDNDNPVDEEKNVAKKNNFPLKVDDIDSENFRYGLPKICKRKCCRTDNGSDRKKCKTKQNEEIEEIFGDFSSRSYDNSGERFDFTQSYKYFS